MIFDEISLLVYASIIYIVSISFLYFSKDRLNNDENKIYKVLLMVNLSGLIVHIGCNLVSKYNNYLPTFVTNTVLKLFLILFIFFTNALLCYFLFILLKNKKRIFMLALSACIIESFLIIIMPINLYADLTKHVYYSYGLSVNFTYIMTSVTILLLFGFLIIKRGKIERKKIIPLYIYIIFGMITMTVQITHLEFVIADCVESFICCLMYFTIENPDIKMLNEMTLAKNEAEKAYMAKSDFLSSMSHEIRTPLNAIVGLSEDNLTYKDKLPNEVIENSNDIMKASQTLCEIVGNILDINKIESNKMEMVEKPYNLKEAVVSLCKVTTIRIGEKPIQFKLNINDDIPYELIGDEVHVKEIINNLLTNAIKYTEKGTINLTISCVNDSIKNISNIIITCQDTGRGIKPEYINKLFNKFERLDIEKNTTTEGTGLGLAITKSLVEMMGGEINIQSKYGYGSIFLVQLPQKISKLTKP